MEPVIECSTVATEGYEISNLISSDQFERQKGFLAERFISGPVIITTKFLCPITIKYIIIWSKVSNQKSLGFELFSLKYTANKQNETDFKRFVSGFVVNNADGVLLHKEGLRVPLEEHTSDVRSFAKRTFLRSRNYENITAVRIKIFKSQYVPAIQKIEIWGDLSPLCSRDIKTKVHKLWSRTECKIVNDNTFVVSRNKSEAPERSSSPSNGLIPEEFLDEITNELMTLPLILPSGKIIDYQTLEKFKEEEAKWGRQPSDPFTGIGFNDKCKPVIATVLKTKIDAYLQLNSDTHFVNILPRYLGGSMCSSDFKVSKVVRNSSTSKRKFNLTNEEEDTMNKIKKLEIDQNHSRTGQSVSCEKLGQILQGLPSFLVAPETKNMDIVKCVICFTSEQLYALPCDHLMCRTCVIRNEHRCGDCQKDFTFAEVQKIHVLGSSSYL